MQVLSRKRALELIGQILDTKKTFKPMKEGGVSGIVLVQALESELERKFIQSFEALQTLGAKDLPVRIAAQEFDSRNGYRLTVGTQAWDLKPQMELGTKHGLSKPTRPDFMLRHSTRSDLKPICIYLDGWEYHHNQLGKDTRQRTELHKQGMRFWTLTWDDLRSVTFPTAIQGGLLEVGNTASFGNAIDHFGLSRLQDVLAMNKFAMLLRYLEQPNDEAWRTLACLLVASNAAGTPPEDGSTWSQSVRSLLPASHEAHESRWLGVDCSRRREAVEWTGRFGRDLTTQTQLVLCIKDRNGFGNNERPQWEDAWRAANLFQFLPDAWFVSENAAEQGTYDGMNWQPKSQPDALEAAYEAVAELLERDDKRPQLVSLLLRLQERQTPAPIGFHEVFEGDAVCGQALFAWPERKAGIVLEEWEKAELDAVGWHSFLVDALETPEEWARLLEVLG